MIEQQAESREGNALANKTGPCHGGQVERKHGSQSTCLSQPPEESRRANRQAMQQESPDKKSAATRIHDETVDYRFHSDPLTQPLAEVSFLRRSLLLAELAYVAYLEEDSAATVVDDVGLRETLFLEEDGSQAYVFRTEHDTIVACRGTEPNEWNDIRADLNALMAVSETVGRVHRGFKKEVDDLWPRLEQELAENNKPLWFTGHSLGGAMATICATRCRLSMIDSNPQELHTFGSPRVGNKTYVNHVKLQHMRWVNNNDLVTRVPPSWMGYRHTGTQLYFDSNGDFRKLTKIQRGRDRWRGFFKGLKKRQFDHFSDHSMKLYVEGIWKCVQQQRDADVESAIG